ncbi:MAG: FkbM family methyltransferase [Candidatus Omnitrophica bacterium]|nr:FkbM family methyltransferase [Candidatus Omnitrophota bacterium]
MLENKRELFLNLIVDIEPRLKKYLSYGSNKVKKALFVKHKALVKVWGKMLKKFFGIDFKYKTKTFWGREICVLPFDRNANIPLFFSSLPEFETIKFLVKRLKENDIFYDIGANLCFYTILAQEFINQEKGEIHAFEPLPEIFSLLCENAKVHYFKNTFLNNLAVSDKIGEAEFYNKTTLSHSGGNSLIFRKELDSAGKIKVKTITLDEYIKTHKPPTIMKIDIEGAEYLALKGAENLLKTYSPIIIMETLGDEFLPDPSLRRNAVALLKEFGYRAYNILSDGEIEEVDYNVFHTMKGVSNYVFSK